MRVRWTPPRLSALLIALLAIAAFAGCSSDDGAKSQGAASQASAREQAPAFALPDQNGATYDFRPGDGKALILVFYMGYF